MAMKSEDKPKSWGFYDSSEYLEALEKISKSERQTEDAPCIQHEGFLSRISQRNWRAPNRRYL